MAKSDPAKTPLVSRTATSSPGPLTALHAHGTATLPPVLIVTLRPRPQRPPAHFYAKNDSAKTPLVDRRGHVITRISDLEYAHPEPRQPKECERVT